MNLSLRPGTHKKRPPETSLLTHLAETMGDGALTLAASATHSLCPKFPGAQADAVSVVRCLKASQGQLASASQEKNAQRFVENAFEGSGLSLPVEIQSMHHDIVAGLHRTLTTYHVKPESWLEYLMKEDPRLLGGATGDFSHNCKSFWEVYRLHHPTHAVFGLHRHRLEQVLPLCIHGDEGRGKRKTGYLVLSFETPFGSTPREKGSSCSCAQHLQEHPELPSYGSSRDDLLEPSVVEACKKMHTNFRGHSYLSRFLLFGLSKTTYKSNPHVVRKLLEEAAAGFTRLFHEGISVDGAPMFAALVSIKGDLDFHTIFFNLERCYSKIITQHGIGRICHMCNAATGTIAPGADATRFEFFEDEPGWVPSLFQSRPWSVEAPLAGVPFDQHGAQERMLAPDAFHVLKMGLGRDLVGGLLIILIRKGFFDYEGSTRNLEDRLERAHNWFILWSKVHSEKPNLRGFSKIFFHMKSLLSAPWSNSKASDTLILLRWLKFVLRLNLERPQVEGYSGLLKIMLQTCESTLEFCRALHSHGLFVSRDCGTYMYIQAMRTLRGYKLVSQRALVLGIRACILKPKSHALHHIAYTLKTQPLSGSPLIINPELNACDVNEDYIGRISRLSRKVGAQVVDLRVIQRVFYKTRALHSRRKLRRN